MESLISAFLGPAATIQIKLYNKVAPTRPPKRIDFPNGGGESLVVFTEKEPVSGEVKISPTRSGIDHIGIKVELVGFIAPTFIGGPLTPFEFLLHVRELEPASMLDSMKTYKFDFENIDKIHESYNGLNVRLRYFIRVTITRHLSPNIAKDQDFWVVNVPNIPEVKASIKSQVGIKNCLLIEVEWAKERFHLNEIIFGKVSFLQVRVKIARMKISLIRREKLGMGDNGTISNETLASKGDSFTHYEVMDGCPVMGEVIPIRLFLSHYGGLTPTYKNVNQQFSVRYYLNVVLIDESSASRKYFKNEEIMLYRADLNGI
jgi:vacuolar protein sorting-associated protein 26